MPLCSLPPLPVLTATAPQLQPHGAHTGTELQFLMALGNAAFAEGVKASPGNTDCSWTETY